MSRAVILTVLVVLGITAPAQASVWKLRTNYVNIFRSANDASDVTTYSAPSGSLFEILDTDGAFTIVRFSKVTSLNIALRFQGAAFFVNAADGANAHLVKIGVNYKIETATLKPYDREIQSGIDWGVLTIPFKWQHADGTLTAGASLGPYIGYRQRFGENGVVTPVLVAGFSNVPTQGANESTIDNRWGVTVALGVVLKVGAPMQLGIVTGFDHLGVSRTSYPYEDKWWTSFAIGFTFLQ
jgi:hypothetical protein